MRSAFGVEHSYEVRKLDDRSKSNARAAGYGAAGVGAGVGLYGGGVPGLKANISPTPPKNAGTGIKNKAKNAYRGGKDAWQTYRGGEFGWRDFAHSHEMNRQTKSAKKTAERVPKGMPSGMSYMMGRDKGAATAEKKVIGHLRTGKKMSNALLGASVVGAGGIYAGKKIADKRRQNVEKSAGDKTERTVAAGTGVTGAGAGMTYGASRVLSGQGKKWDKYAADSKKAAEKADPRFKSNLSGRDISSMGLHHKVDRKAAQEAGFHRGKATQAGHFAHEYKVNAKVFRRASKPLAAATALGAAGLTGSAIVRNRKQKQR